MKIIHGRCMRIEGSYETTFITSMIDTLNGIILVCFFSFLNTRRDGKIIMNLKYPLVKDTKMKVRL